MPRRLCSSTIEDWAGLLLIMAAFRLACVHRAVRRDVLVPRPRFAATALRRAPAVTSPGAGRSKAPLRRTYSSQTTAQSATTPAIPSRPASSQL